MGIVLLGIGSTIRPLFPASYSLGDTFWLGLGICVAVLEIWSLVGPISFATTRCLLVLGRTRARISSSDANRAGRES